MSHCSWQQPQEGHPHLADKEGKPHLTPEGRKEHLLEPSPFLRPEGCQEVGKGRFGR